MRAVPGPRATHRGRASAVRRPGWPGPHGDVALTARHPLSAHEGDEQRARRPAAVTMPDLDLGGRRDDPADDVGGEQQHRRRRSTDSGSTQR